MTDQLRDSFESFRATSTQQTRPPGVPAIRHAIARRHAKRGVALAVAAVAGVAIAVVPFHTGGAGTSPSQQLSRSSRPTSSPTPLFSAGTGVSPILPPPNVGIPPADPPATVPTKPPCGPFGSYPIASLLSSTDADTFTISNALIAACPTIHLHVSRAVYVGLGATTSTLTLDNSVTNMVTPTSRTTTMPTLPLPSDACSTSLIVTVVGTNMPGSIPNLVPQLASSGDDRSAATYFHARDFTLLETAWTQPVC